MRVVGAGAVASIGSAAFAANSAEGRPISQRLVAALDAGRALAAFYVVAHHIINAWMEPAPAMLFMRFGQEAVLVFFLLSGFVIFANERTRALSPRGYYLRRLRRIYPPLLLAMLVSTLVAWSQNELALFDARQFWATLFSLQDISRLKPGVIADPYMLNDPLWSLSYEVLFYLIFPPILMAWKRWPVMTEHAIGLGSCLLYLVYAGMPGHFQLVGAYFIVWWSGAMAARAWQDGGRNVLAMRRTYLWLLALCVVAAAVVSEVGYRGLGFYPFLQLRHFAVAALLLPLLYGPIGRACARLLERAGPAAKWFAGISYGLYVLHYPLVIQWNFSATVPGLIVGLILLFALSYAVDRVLPRYLPKAPSD